MNSLYNRFDRVSVVLWVKLFGEYIFMGGLSLCVVDIQVSFLKGRV